MDGGSEWTPGNNMSLKPLLLLSAFAVVGAANADVLAGWNFDSTTVPTTASSDLAAIAADNGAGSATAHHSLSTTVYSTPAGNGSAKSLSSTAWSAGDYYQFSLSSTGFTGLSVSLDQTGSNTGPSGFGLSVSKDGGSTFTSLGTYTVTNDSWSSNTASYKAVSNHAFTLGSTYDKSASLIFRVSDLNTTAINGGTVAAGGTGRIDNFIVSGTAAAVPEPSSIAALGLGAVAILRRRRATK